MNCKIKYLFLLFIVAMLVPSLAQAAEFIQHGTIVFAAESDNGIKRLDTLALPFTPKPTIIKNSGILNVNDLDGASAILYGVSLNTCRLPERLSRQLEDLRPYKTKSALIIFIYGKQAPFFPTYTFSDYTKTCVDRVFQIHFENNVISDQDYQPLKEWLTKKVK